MTALAALSRGRRRAESLMLDVCTITRVTGEPGPIDPETGLRTPAPTTQVYAGRCKVQTFEAHETRPESGEHRFTIQRYRVDIPVGAGPVQVGDQVQVTTAVADTALVGRRYEVAGLLHKSMATAQRLIVDETTG